MPNILKLNKLGKAADRVFPKEYTLLDSCENPDGIIVRSFKMTDKEKFTLPQSVLCVARAGAGTDNIPVAEYADKGVVVFNTPGANANAVKELVICSLFLCGRKIVDGINWAGTLKDGETTVKAQVEAGKSQFVGGEILNKTIGIVGLGAIGILVAETANALGMTVYGYDPHASKEKLEKIGFVKMVNTMDEIYSACDFISLHVPANDATKGMINKDTLAKCKDGVNIVNAARGELVKNADIIEAVKSGKVNRYVIDFPVTELLNIQNIITIPHLGASTPEAEDNCVEMAGIQLVDFMENGNVVNSVNFPMVRLERGKGKRCTIAYKGDVDIKKELEKMGCKINGFACGKKGDYGYAIADCECSSACGTIKDVAGVLKVRCL